MNKTRLVVFFMLLPSIPAHADFFWDVVKGVAINVISDAISPRHTVIVQHSRSESSTIAHEPIVRTEQLHHVRTIRGSERDANRVRAIVATIVNTNIPLEERIGLYATRVDYFSAGVVNHRFILKDRRAFRRRWPHRQYTISSIDEVVIDPDRKFAVARYTLDYVVSRPGRRKTGISHAAVLIGSFDVQPRIYAIKEWVQRD